MVYLWVALYGLTHSLSRTLSQAIPGASWIVPLAMLLYMLLLILWICRKGISQSIRLCIPTRLPTDAWLGLIPLFLLPCCNLLTADGFHPDLSVIALMLSISVTEEIFFRGFLLQAISKHGIVPAIFATSLLFSLFHGVNLIHGATPFHTMMQMLCAFASGLCYCTAAIRVQSLLPCFAAHFLTNITGSIQIRQYGCETAGLWICIGVCLCCGIWHSSIICKYDKEIQS